MGVIIIVVVMVVDVVVVVRVTVFVAWDVQLFDDGCCSALAYVRRHLLAPLELTPLKQPATQAEPAEQLLLLGDAVS